MIPAYDFNGVRIFQGDALETLRQMPAESVNCCVTSPPYFNLRDYQMPGQIGMEASPAAYVARLVEMFGEVQRVLTKDGTLWLNLGDSYAAKNLLGIPWRVAFALQEAGWNLRMDIIWNKPAPMPESVTDRPTKAHEYIFLLSKSEKYYYDAEAIGEAFAGTRMGASGARSLPYSKGSGRADTLSDGIKGGLGISPLCGFKNKRSVWTVSGRESKYSGAHFATFPPDLIVPCILAGCPEGGTVLDPFFGSGTTGLVAKRHGRKAVGIELNLDYICLAQKRLQQGALDMFEDEQTNFTGGVK